MSSSNSLIRCGCAAEGIKLARAEGAEWVMHVDTDELMYPGGAPHYSLQAVLAAVPRHTDTVVFPNYESLPERDDVADPFTEARRPPPPPTPPHPSPASSRPVSPAFQPSMYAQSSPCPPKSTLKFWGLEMISRYKYIMDFVGQTSGTDTVPEGCGACVCFVSVLVTF